MPTTRKTAKKKTAKKKTAAAKSPSRSAASAGKAARQKLSLLERLEELGLLDSAGCERLAVKARELAGIEDAVGWDRALTRNLGAVSSDGGAGSWAALVAWQSRLAGVPSTCEGIRDALETLARVVPYAGASLFTRDPDRDRMVPLIHVNFPVELIGRVRFDEGLGFSAWVAARKKPVLYGSLHRNEAPDANRVRSFLTVPLVVGDACVGVLNLGHTEDGFYTPEALRTAIVAGTMLAGLVQRVLAQAQIAAREIQDPELGLATPGYLQRRLHEEVVRCRELGHAMSVATLRLNELPGFTEQFGGEFRRRCRSDLARLIQAWRKPADLVGLGEGDAVTVILPSTRSERAEERLKELVGRIERHNFPRRKRMSVTFGIATYPSDAEDPQGLLECADKANQENEVSRLDAEGSPSIAA